jgi:uncharacterized protein
MELTGKHIVNAPSSSIWTVLMHTETLAKIIPGISRLEKTGDNAFKSILEIKLGPVNSSFTGKLHMEEITDQEGFVLKLMQNSKIGNASGDIKINLSPVDHEKTEITFHGEVKLSGLLAGMGQRVVGSVAHTLAKQFFKNLEEELAHVTG